MNSKLSAMAFDPVSDYPLGSRRPDLVRTPSGLGLADLTLDAVRAGEVGAEDLRATPETLRRQSAVAAPMPLAAPVTSATRPLKSYVFAT